MLLAVSLIAALVLSEYILNVIGYGNEQKADEIVEVKPAEWWICDEDGCRFDKSKVDREKASDVRRVIERSNNWERLLTLNKAGYHDSDEFEPGEELNKKKRILVLGDSFTWGATAPVGHAWVEVLERGLSRDNDFIVWNTAIPAIGTRQELKTLEKYSAIMKPHIVLLGFYVNDFDDNLYPLDMYFRNYDGKAIKQYLLNEDMEPIKMSLGDAFTRATGKSIQEEDRVAGSLMDRSRAISLIRAAIGQRIEHARMYYGDKHDNFGEEKKRKAEELTRSLVEKIQETSDENDSRLIVLLIPSRKDIDNPTDMYAAAKKIFKELNVECIELREDLTIDDYAMKPDPHWNEKGHKKAGEKVRGQLLKSKLSWVNQ